MGMAAFIIITTSDVRDKFTFIHITVYVAAHKSADHEGCSGKAVYCLPPLKTEILDSNPTRSMNVYAFLCVYAVMCRQRSCDYLSLVQQFLLNLYKQNS